MPQIFQCPSRTNRAAAYALAIALSLGTTQAQTPGEKSQAQILTELQNAALKAFQQGNWGEAASGFEKLLREVPNEMQPQMGTIYLTLGAAYYNMPNFDKAIEVFTGFITKFPNSDRLLDAKLA